MRSLSLPAPSDRVVVYGFFLIASIISAASLPGLFEHGSFSGRFIGTYSLQWVVLLSIVILLTAAEIAVLLLMATDRKGGLARAARLISDSLSRWGYFNMLAFALPWAIFVLAVLYRFEKNLAHFLPRVWLFLLAAALGAVFLSALFKKITYFWAFLSTAVLYSAGIKAVGYFPDISAYPFSISWSEASRYYYASLPYARSLFSMDIPLSPWHPSRYLLQGMAFWLPEAGIWVHRLWQVVLWLGMPLLTGLVFVRRFQLSRDKAFILVVWSFLFLLQGPVYYHLLVSVVLVLWGFDAKRFWKTLIFVVLASLWAGISRVNWIPVPAFLAAALYLLNVPVSSSRGWIRYSLIPAAWGAAGVLAALTSQAAYVLVSGHEDTSGFASSFTSDLLWYRLLPNPTYPMGVFPAIMLVSLPLMLLVSVNWVRNKSGWHPIRIFGLSAMAFILLAGGLVVSTKIGGGSNIHNLDAFIVLLLIVGASIGLGGFALEKNQLAGVWRPWLLVMVIIAVPVIWNIDVGDPFIKRKFAQAEYDLEKLSAIVHKYSAEGEVLFITQRQLIVFDMIPGVNMVPEYELLTLSEMSISNNRAYLNRFYKDLENHRFTLIIADIQYGATKDPLIDSFAEENNAWAVNIAPYLLKYYQSDMVITTQGIDTLVPRP
jgi:hypothetical protein